MRTPHRRHHDARIRKRRLQLPRNAFARGDKRAEGRLTDTGTVCSCNMCRRARRYCGPTRQERRAELDDLLRASVSAFRFWDNELDREYDSL